MGAGYISAGIERPGRDYATRSRAEVKITLLRPFLHSVHKDNLTLRYMPNSRHNSEHEKQGLNIEYVIICARFDVLLLVLLRI
jgi:hypothetical protein